MNVTDVEGLGVESLGVALMCSGPSGAPLAVTASPDRCPRTVPSSAAVVVNLAQDDLAARFLRDGDTYWEQPERVFAREGLCTLSRGGWLYLALVRIIQIPRCVENVEL